MFFDVFGHFAISVNWEMTYAIVLLWYIEDRKTVVTYFKTQKQQKLDIFRLF